MVGLPFFLKSSVSVWVVDYGLVDVLQEHQHLFEFAVLSLQSFELCASSSFRPSIYASSGGTRPR